MSGSVPDAGTSPNTAALQAALDAERRRSADLEQRVADGQRRLSAESAGRFQAEESAVDNAITAATEKVNGFQADYAAASANGDHAAAAKAQRDLAEAAAELHDYRRQKQQLSRYREQQSREPERREPSFDDFVGGFPANVQSWVREHPRMFSDRAYHGAVVNAHYAAQRQHLQPGSSEYFSFVERDAAEQLGEGGQRTAASSPAADPAEQAPSPAADEPQEDTVIETQQPAVDVSQGRVEQPQQRAASPGSMASVAARPSRSAPGASTRLPNQPRRLTADQADAARRLAQSLRPDLRNDADVFRWYDDMYNSPTAQDLKRSWAQGA